MRKTRPSGRRPKLKMTGPHETKHHNVPVDDLFLHARSLHDADKTLLESLQPNTGPLSVPDVCPIVLLYRQALELHMKGMILGGGGSFLATKPDQISIRKSHSVSWLAQFVCQIVTALSCQDDFNCEGVEDLAAFKRVVDDINSVDPGVYTFHWPFDPQDLFAVREFGRKMDSLLTLLDATADALAAEWDIRSDDTDLEAGWPKETIQ